jgi:hypothetical protein
MTETVKKLSSLILSAAVLMTLLTGCEPEPEPISVPSPAEIFAVLEESGFFSPPWMTDMRESDITQFDIIAQNSVSITAKEAEMSAVFLQIIIVETQQGKSNAVFGALLAHQELLQDATAYPQGAVAAAASRAGLAAGGAVAYLICDERADEIEETILNLIEQGV